MLMTADDGGDLADQVRIPEVQPFHSKRGSAAFSKTEGKSSPLTITN